MKNLMEAAWRSEAEGDGLAQKKLDWIKAQVAAGKTVYLSTHTKATKITAKYLDAVRVKNGNLEVRHGGSWLDHNYSKISAS